MADRNMQPTVWKNPLIYVVLDGPTFRIQFISNTWQWKISELLFFYLFI